MWTGVIVFGVLITAAVLIVVTLGQLPGRHARIPRDDVQTAGPVNRSWTLDNDERGGS